MGDLIDCFGGKWLVTSVDIDKSICTTGTVELCRHTLRWQDTDGTIYEEYCVIDISDSISHDDGKTFSTINKEYKVSIPYNDGTKQFKLKKRFLMDSPGNEPSAYIITGFESCAPILAGDHLMTLYLERTEFNPKTDNAELMIADYFNPKDDNNPPEIELPIYTISYTGDPVIRVGGKKIFSANRIDESENINADIVPIWDVILPENLEGKINFTCEGNKITVLSVFDISVIGEEFLIVLSCGGEKVQQKVKVVTAY